MARVNLNELEQKDRLICVEKSAIDEAGGEAMFDAAGQPTEKWKAIERLLSEADVERARCAQRLPDTACSSLSTCRRRFRLYGDSLSPRHGAGHESCSAGVTQGMHVTDRRKNRVGLKVIHKHRIGDKVFRRVSELVLIDGQPKALLGWIDMGGVRTPIYLCDLDHRKLHRSASSPNTYYYEEITVDPRFEAYGPSALGGDPASLS